MPEPSVCAIMLTRDRPEYARRAVECFRAQTYGNKHIVIFQEFPESGFRPTEIFAGMTFDYFRGDHKAAIGELRNQANQTATQWGEGHPLNADILIHWDDDDYSHPNRIAEQVAILQSSGADVVGYKEMLFWREPRHKMDRNHCDGEAWLYTNRNPTYALGTSLCYWRKTWERKPFEATSHGEDLKFCAGIKVAGVPSGKLLGGLTGLTNVKPSKDAAPRMIARIHGGNTSDAYRPDKMQRAAEWRRVPEWDTYCAGVMR